VDTIIKTAIADTKTKIRLPIACVFLTSSTRGFGNKRCKLSGGDASCADGGEKAPIFQRERDLSEEQVKKKFYA
jgi:hypothetical protein